MVPLLQAIGWLCMPYLPRFLPPGLFQAAAPSSPFFLCTVPAHTLGVLFSTLSRLLLLWLSPLPPASARVYCLGALLLLGHTLAFGSAGAACVDEGLMRGAKGLFSFGCLPGLPGQGVRFWYRTLWAGSAAAIITAASAAVAALGLYMRQPSTLSNLRFGGMPLHLLHLLSTPSRGSDRIGSHYHIRSQPRIASDARFASDLGPDALFRRLSRPPECVGMRGKERLGFSDLVACWQDLVFWACNFPCAGVAPGVRGKSTVAVGFHKRGSSRAHRFPFVGWRRDARAG